LKLQFEFILYAIVGFRVNILFMLIEFEQEIKKNNNNKSQFSAKNTFQNDNKNKKITYLIKL